MERILKSTKTDLEASLKKAKNHKLRNLIQSELSILNKFKKFSGGLKYEFLIGQSHLRFKSRVSESSLRIYQEKGSKDEAASTDFAFLCFLKLDAYFLSIPSIILSQ